MGFPACVTSTATGEHDVKSYRLFDPDTKCLLKIGAGPSMHDNDVVAKCAKAAEANIGPDNIKPGGDAATPDGEEGGAPVPMKL